MEDEIDVTFTKQFEGKPYEDNTVVVFTAGRSYVVSKKFAKEVVEKKKVAVYINNEKKEK